MVCLMERILENKIEKKTNELENLLRQFPEKINEQQAKYIIQKIIGYDSPSCTKKYEPSYTTMLNEINNNGYVSKEELKRELVNVITHIYSPWYNL
ncbi:MAG: hypothetical protein QXU20_01100 [Candidatus Woesearchaeota archaeon]